METENQPTKPNYRMGRTSIVIIVFLAGVADLLSVIPFVGDFISPIFWLFAAVYFWKNGLGMLNPGRLATSLISLVAEIIPFVQALPTIFAGTVVIIVMSRIEDRTGFSLNPLKKPGVTPPRMQRSGVNTTAGIRPPNSQL